jgi:hypothetical protein
MSTGKGPGSVAGGDGRLVRERLAWRRYNQEILAPGSRGGWGLRCGLIRAEVGEGFLHTPKRVLDGAAAGRLGQGKACAHDPSP